MNKFPGNEFLVWIWSSVDADLLLYIGDPTNLDFSEDRNVFNVSVGQKNQKYYLQDVDDVIVTLDRLNNLKNTPPSSGSGKVTRIKEKIN